mmetsp:Transcript_13556/g.36414  ORF Transcript_13556/g.36414 Transcript_13556/m.36414 type:complete len:114 (-) Transcript_13556:238-579(-)
MLLICESVPRCGLIGLIWTQCRQPLKSEDTRSIWRALWSRIQQVRGVRPMYVNDNLLNIKAQVLDRLVALRSTFRSLLQSTSNTIIVVFKQKKKKKPLLVSTDDDRAKKQDAR